MRPQCCGWFSLADSLNELWSWKERGKKTCLCFCPYFLPIIFFHFPHPLLFPITPSFLLPSFFPSASSIAITPFPSHHPLPTHHPLALPLPFYLLILPSSLVPLPFSSHDLLLISFLFFKLLFVLERHIPHTKLIRQKNKEMLRKSTQGTAFR